MSAPCLTPGVHNTTSVSAFYTTNYSNTLLFTCNWRSWVPRYQPYLDDGTWLFFVWMDMREKAVSITASASPGVASATAKWEPRSTALLGVGGDSCASALACIL